MHRFNFPERRAARRQAAEEAIHSWRLLTIDEQLKQLKDRPGESKKQVARLMALKDKGHKFLPVTKEEKATRPPEQAETITDEASAKAPPKSDIKATKAFKKKHGAKEE